ncbi:MAG TPA: outer membrane beta-barrel protein, partial [Polyangiaceae bacterium]|nr:outer membrane beta-barrel protein [Polyangiaceae bacterium]
IAIRPSEDDGGRFCRDHWMAMGNCRNRRWARPELLLGADLGISAMTETSPFGFNKGVGGVTGAGPAWDVRAGVDFFPWLGLEARYVGMYNAAQRSVSPGGDVGFLTTGIEAVVRFTAPTPYVRPYIFAGIAYYDVSLVGSAQAQEASSLHSSSQPGIPLGFGFDVPLTWYLSVDLEATYHFQLGESFSDDTTTTKGGSGIDGGDLSTFNAGVRVRL